jgi:hypothetical protein
MDIALSRTQAYVTYSSTFIFDKSIEDAREYLDVFMVGRSFLVVSGNKSNDIPFK